MNDEMVKLELSPDNPKIDPGKVEGVIVVNGPHVTRRWGVQGGYTVFVPKKLLDITITILHENGWDSNIIILCL